MKLEKSQNWPGWKEAVPYGTIFYHKQWHAPNCRFERTKVSVPRVILACASPLASLVLSGSGQRERGGELQLMIEPHWFLFVHKKVFMLQITEIIGCCHNIHLLSGFCIGFIHISLVMMWGRSMGWVLGMLSGCLSPSTSIIDYRPQRIKDDSYRTCDRKISLWFIWR